MKEHTFNGSFEYTPDYSCEKDDLLGVQQVMTGVKHITPIVDMNLGNERVVLLNVTRHRSEDECLLLNAEDGTKYFYVPEDPVPSSREEFAGSMRQWVVGGKGESKIASRSNLWKQAHHLSRWREEVADHIIESDPVIDIVNEREAGDGFVEMEIEYDDRLVHEVASYYNVDPEDVSEQLISDFIVVALTKEVAKRDV